MTDFERAFAKLQKVGAKITYRRGTIPSRLVKQQLRPAYAAVCSNYKNTTLEQRIDTYVFFETRDNMLEELLRFAGDSAQETANHLRVGKSDRARACVEQAVAAELIVDGRAEPNLIDETQQHINQAVREVGFNRQQFASKLTLNAATFVKAALRLQSQEEPLEAIEALGIALQMKPELADHSKTLDLAVRLTGKSADDALALLQDRFERTLYVDEQVRLQARKDRRRRQKAAQEPQPRFWLVTIVGTIFLAVLPPVAFPLVFGMEAGPDGIPPGLIVGAVTSAVFLMNQLRQRNQPSR